METTVPDGRVAQTQVRRPKPQRTKVMRIRPILFGAMLTAWGLTTVACNGKLDKPETKPSIDKPETKPSIDKPETKPSIDTPSIVGTWTRKHEGEIVHEITFTAEGRFNSLNPRTG